MTDCENPTDPEHDTENELLIAYRHDAHKLTGHSHDAAPETFAGVPVNQTVPYGADRAASALSRPGENPEQTVKNHDTHYRLSLLTGQSQDEGQQFSRDDIKTRVRDLFVRDDPETLHRAWLENGSISVFNESVYYPYTSLKYHTLLVAALVDNFRAGHEFADLQLIVDPADQIVSHRTIYSDERFSLRIDTDSYARPAASLGTHPWTSWAPTWSRLSAHPLETDNNTYARVLDANLRRISSWSTALQYLEDFQEAFDR